MDRRALFLIVLCVAATGCASRRSVVIEQPSSSPANTADFVFGLHPEADPGPTPVTLDGASIGAVGGGAVRTIANGATDFGATRRQLCASAPFAARRAFDRTNHCVEFVQATFQVSEGTAPGPVVVVVGSPSGGSGTSRTPPSFGFIRHGHTVPFILRTDAVARRPITVTLTATGNVSIAPATLVLQPGSLSVGRFEVTGLGAGAYAVEYAGDGIRKGGMSGTVGTP